MTRAFAIPKRYEAIRRLGKGGGGEVWAVRDRVRGLPLALKVLSEGASEDEARALVREAVALRGLEGLGVPRVLAFGTLPESGNRYMVRELVEGESLEAVLDRPDGPSWLMPLADICAQLTVLHRTGLLHGDIKPANIIVGDSGTGTLVDLGLAAPWREGGTAPSGLTPRYAAPELLRGEPLTVRAEVYAVGATLADAIHRRGAELESKLAGALQAIATRATQSSPSARYPSVDEIASDLRHAAKLPDPTGIDEIAWPVVGFDAFAATLAKRVAKLGKGEGLAVVGPAGAGSSTLVRRLGWTLGIEGTAVSMLEAPNASIGAREAVDLELSSRHGDERPEDRVIVLDDLAWLDDDARDLVRHASSRGARVVAVGPPAVVQSLVAGTCTSVDVPPLDDAAAEELLLRAMPSLSEALRAHLVRKGEGRPGVLRSYVRRLRGKVVVSPDEVDELLAGTPTLLDMGSGEAPLVRAQKALDGGRVDDAADILARTELAKASDDERALAAVLHARVLLGRGDPKEAAISLADSEALATNGPHKRAWLVTSARAALRQGDYAKASEQATLAVDGKHDGVAADALSVRGLALAFTGGEGPALKVLTQAVDVATECRDSRVRAIALGSLAIAHQRAGRGREARTAYEEALGAAEDARDASAIATMRLNLAVIAQGEGDFALALQHLEASVDMGRRAGGLVAVQQALLNLANLDLYLGRYSKAAASLESLGQARDRLGMAARAQLFGLEAELATRRGELQRGADLYDACGDAWEAQARPRDAAEARLEALLVRARLPGVDPRLLDSRFTEIRARLGESGFGEHGSLAELLRGVVASLSGEEAKAKAAFDESLALAQKGDRREWAWRALDARARLAVSQGATTIAKRDMESAVALLEETAAKLPRDLREVFWDDPRRRALRQSHTATVPAMTSPSGTAGSSPTSTGMLARSPASLFLNAKRPADDRLARIMEITRELANEHDMTRLLAKVTDHAIGLLVAERGFVVLVNERGELETQAARVRGGDDDPHAKFSRSVAERVIHEGEPVIATSARDDERLAKAVSVHQLMIQSIACVPIRGAPPAGKTIGALYVETRVRPGSLFTEELPTLLAFADQAAIAIESARLIEENKARAEDLARTNAELVVAKDKLAEILGRRTEQLAATRRDLRQVRAELKNHFGYGDLVGTSAAMRRVYALVERVKDTDVPILVTGESGTGKEVVAKTIHGASPRAKAPFIGINCGAIPENLLEGELFGHVKGAFTGADRDRKGLFREAEGGTILLDEIGEMPLKMQTGLLRVLQERKVRAVGATEELDVDVRVIAATNRNLADMVAEGTFREDLFYRLDVVEMRVPPLRERPDDIPALIDHFLTIFALRHRRERKAVSREALRRLVAHPWPGNVRQLEHVLLNGWLMSDEDEIGADDLSLSDPNAKAARTEGSRPGRSRAESAAVQPGSEKEFKESERQRILSALAASNWNRAQAAKILGVPRRTFYRRLKEFGIL